MIVSTHHQSQSDKLIKEFIPVYALINNLNVFQRQRVKISAISNFSDDHWNFSIEKPIREKNETILRFDLLVEDNVKLTAGKFPGLVDSMKCLAYSLLFDPPRSDLTLTTIIKTFRKGHGIGNLYWYLAVNGIEKVADLSEYQFEEMLNYFKSKPRALYIKKPLTNKTLYGRIHGVEWIYQQNNKLEDCFAFNPWSKDETCGRWAKRNADVFVPKNILSTQPWTDRLIRLLLQAALSELSNADRLWSRISTEQSEKLAFFTKRFLPYKKIFEHASHLMVPSSIELDYVMLRSSVYLLIGCFSGMRSSELLSMLGDPGKCCNVHEERIGDKVIKGYFINSKLRKYQPVPKAEEWQTIPIVHDAISILAIFNAAMTNHDSPFLFRSATKSKLSTRGREFSNAVIVVGLNNFVKRYDIDLSEVDGRISSMDLRRTFARLVTRSGLGLLELQTQLKHLDPSLSMMYGSPSIREYLAEERGNWSKDQYDELLKGRDQLIGGGATEIGAMRVRFAGLTRPEKDAFLKALPKQALIDQVGDGLCLYRPERALCGGEKVSCRPADCSNSVIKAADVIKTLRFRKQENERLLKLYSMQPAKREHLKVQILTLTKLIDQACL